MFKGLNSLVLTVRADTRFPIKHVYLISPVTFMAAVDFHSFIKIVKQQPSLHFKIAATLRSSNTNRLVIFKNLQVDFMSCRDEYKSMAVHELLERID